MSTGRDELDDAAVLTVVAGASSAFAFELDSPVSLPLGKGEFAVPEGGVMTAELSSFCNVPADISADSALCGVEFDFFISTAFLAASSPACRIARLIGVWGPPAALVDLSSIGAFGGLDGVTFVEAEGVPVLTTEPMLS